MLLSKYRGVLLGGHISHLGRFRFCMLPWYFCSLHPFNQSNQFAKGVWALVRLSLLFHGACCPPISSHTMIHLLLQPNSLETQALPALIATSWSSARAEGLVGSFPVSLFISPLVFLAFNFCVFSIVAPSFPPQPSRRLHRPPVGLSGFQVTPFGTTDRPPKAFST